MEHRKLVLDYYIDINNLIDILSRLTNDYRLLVGSAGELNQITLAKKSDVKKTLKRVEEVGELIDHVLHALDDTEQTYTQYCKMRAEVIRLTLEYEDVRREIEACLEKKEKV